MTINSELMLFVADVIEAENRFNLNYFGFDPDAEDRVRYLEPSPEQIINQCSTTACIAGWVNALDAHALDDTAHAGELLGLTEDQYMELFVPHEFPGYRGATVWGLLEPYKATATYAAALLREIANGTRKFACDR